MVKKMEFNGTFLAVIISFLVFVFLMNKLLYEPIRKIVNQRNNFVSDNYENAEINNKKADELNSECDEKITEAKDDARTKYNEIVNDFKNQKSEIIQNTQNEVKAEQEESYAFLNNASNEAKENLRGRMCDLANDIIEKVLGYRSEVQGFDNEEVSKILYH